MSEYIFYMGMLKRGKSETHAVKYFQAQAYAIVTVGISLYISL